MTSLSARFKKWFSAKTEECKTVTPLFSHSFDRKLTLLERLRVRLHLYTCRACLNYVSNLGFIHEALGAQEEEFRNEKFRAALGAESKERIKQALKSAE